MKLLLSALLLLAAVATRAQPVPDSLDLKIGQMVMVGIGDRTALTDGDALGSALSAGAVGGVVLFEKNLSKTHTSDRLKALVSALQRRARYPLFISIDEEGGKVHRLKEKYGFFSLPTAARLGRINKQDSTLYYNRKLAALLSGLGINLNYAPSVDMAVNPANTVIVRVERSFGRQAGLVAAHAAWCIQAHRENQVGTVLKHFPGHGSSATDSHLGLVDVTKTWKKEELRPYDTLIRAGLCDAVMVAHVINRQWDESMLPATLSHKVVTGMLRGELGFQGLVFSDDMQMKAIADHYGLERAVGLSINAGVDVLMFGNVLPANGGRVGATQLRDLIRKLVLNKTIPQARIDESYRRIVAYKAKHHIAPAR